MDKKDIQQLLDAQTKALKANQDNQTKHLIKETERHERVILEEFEHRLSVVAEGHIGLERTLDNHTKILDDHTRKLTALMEMVAMNTEAIAMNTETLEFIKGMLKRKVDLEEYERLEKRVALLEKKLRVSGA